MSKKKSNPNCMFHPRALRYGDYSYILSAGATQLLGVPKGKVKLKTYFKSTDVTPTFHMDINAVKVYYKPLTAEELNATSTEESFKFTTFYKTINKFSKYYKEEVKTNESETLQPTSEA